MLDPLDDILGGGSAPEPDRPKRGRPTREEAARRAAEALEHQVSMKAAASGRGLEDVGGVQALRRPVTINTLATIFEHDVQTITRRLVECPYVTVGNRKLYSFKEACAYIVKPKMTPEQFVRTLNSAQMPPEINKVFWDAQRSRVKYKIEAQESWETEDVHAALTGLCQVLKEGLSTLTETLRDRAKLEDGQAEMVDTVLDDLRNQLVEKMVAFAEATPTPSMFGKPLFGAPGVSTDGVEVDEFEDTE